MINSGLRLSGLSKHRASLPGIVQQTTMTGVNSSGLTYFQNVTAGNLLIVVVGWEGGWTSDITDTVGTSWSYIQNTNGGARCCVCYGYAGGSGPNTVKFAAGVPSYGNFSLLEVSGLSTTVDSYVNTTASGVTSTNITINYDDDFLVLGGTGYHNGVLFSVGSGMTLLPKNNLEPGNPQANTGWANGYDALSASYCINPSTGTFTASVNNSESDNSSLIAAAFRHS
jgi:hypothetical protein